VAFRTCLLQALCLPTDEPDPDTVGYERTPAPSDEEIDTWAEGLRSRIISDSEPDVLRGLWMEVVNNQWASAKLKNALKAELTARAEELGHNDGSGE
jgi:hypothetical protein